MSCITVTSISPRPTSHADFQCLFILALGDFLWCMCRKLVDKKKISFESWSINYTLNSEPNALTGDKSEGIKAEGSRGFYPRIYPQLKPYCLTQENYPGLSKKTKDKLPWAKSKTTRSAAKPPLLGWRCAPVRILVFPSTCFRRVADGSGGYTQESWARAARFKLALWRILCCSLHFFPFQLRIFEVFPQSGVRRV